MDVDELGVDSAGSVMVFNDSGMDLEDFDLLVHLMRNLMIWAWLPTLDTVTLLGMYMIWVWVSFAWMLMIRGA